MSDLGERLGQLERIAAEQLHDISRRDPVEALRTLPEVVEAAGSIWQALPGPVREHDAMDRLLQTTEGLARVMVNHAPPYRRGNALDDGQLTLAEALTQAEPLAPSSTDPQSARTLLMHIVHLSSHDARLVVASELSGPIMDLRGNPYDKTLLQRGLGTLVGVDELAGSYLRNSYPRELNGPTRDPVDHQDLGRILARWDITAQRAISSAHAPSTLVQVAAGNARIYQGLQSLVRDAQLSHAQVGSMLAVRMEDASRAWAQTGAFWQDLHSPRASPGTLRQPLHQARREVQSMLHELLIDPAGRRRPPKDTIGGLDMRETAETIHQALVSATGHARALHDVVRDPENILVSPRMVQQFITRERELRGKDTKVASVNPKDLLLNRPIPMPAEARRAVTAHINHVVTASRAAFENSELTSTRYPAAAPSPARGTAPSRRPEHSSPATPEPGAGLRR